MKYINTFNINSSPIAGNGESRSYRVTGDENAVFSMIVLNEDGHYYNFPENTIASAEENIATPSGSFSATPVKLLKKTLTNGEYSGSINFPKVTDDDEYTIILEADGGSDTYFLENLSTSNAYHYDTIPQIIDTTLTFSLSSTGSDGTYNTYPSNYTSTGLSSKISRKEFNTSFSISWAVSLGSSQFVIARQPVINDFYFTTTKDTLNAGSGTSLELKDITGLSTGMVVSGTGIASASIITKVIKGYKDQSNSTAAKPVYIVPATTPTSTTIGGTVIIDKSSTFVADRTITFKGFGSDGANTFNGTNFKIKNFKLVIDPVVTTTDAAVDNSTTIPITSTDGIKAADTVLMTGIGVTSSSPHVDAVSSGVNITASSAQTIEDGQTVTFTGSSRTGTITADVEIKKYGRQNLTLTLELDNILTVG